MKFGRNWIALLALVAVICIAVYFLYGRDGKDVAEKPDTGAPDRPVSEETIVSEDVVVSKVVVPEGALYVPLYTYRTGPFGPSGAKTANGLLAYFETIMKRDGGVEGRPIVWEECEFGYKTDRGVECYERLKGKGSLVSNPFSTP